MTIPLLDISGKIDPVSVAIYELIISVTETQNIKFCLVGAAARDLVFHHGYDIAVRRMTNDIDLAVQVSAWSDFETLKNRLVETGQFTQTRMTHRLQYRETIPVDIVSFGAIADTDAAKT
jgi:predicted nucleotidyltransferase